MVSPALKTLFSFGIVKRAGPSSSQSPATPAAAPSPATPPEPPTAARPPATPAPARQGKKLVFTTEAIRKRRERALKSRVKKAKGVRRERAASDSEKAQARAQATTPATENETHYEDARGRKRKLKTVRTRALESGEMGGKQRAWTPTERELVVALNTKMGKPGFSRVATELHRLHPTIFGPGSPGKPNGIMRQDVRTIVQRHEKDTISDGRGRPTALPAALMIMIVAAMGSVVSARATIISAPMLQPVAIGVILASGHASLLNAARRDTLAGKMLQGVFCCGLHFIRGLMRDNGWRCVRPQSDTRKVPDDWQEKTWKMVLRLAYFVFVHEIPRALVINADHTGIMFAQIKGRTWITKEMAKAGDKSVSSFGDKRQFTLLASSSAAGDCLPHQVVIQGKGKRSLPKLGTYSISMASRNSKGNFSVCFVLSMAVAALANMASFCCTSNHWSDDVTSKAYVKDVAVPYFKKKIATLRAEDPKSCKPFGTQICVVIFDMWWGWLDRGFISWVKENYPVRACPCPGPHPRPLVIPTLTPRHPHATPPSRHATLTPRHPPTHTPPPCSGSASSMSQLAALPRPSQWMQAS